MTSALWRPAHCHLLSRIPNDVATLSAQARHEPWSHGVGRHLFKKKSGLKKANFYKCTCLNTLERAQKKRKVRISTHGAYCAGGIAARGAMALAIPS